MANKISDNSNQHMPEALTNIISGIGGRVRQQTVTRGSVFFYLCVVLILAKALALRLALPHIVFIDGDISGYLNPALNYLSGRDFDPGEIRGFYYPFFVLINIVIGHSIDSVAICQHLLSIAGLILVVFALIGTNSSSKTGLIKPVIVLFGLMFIGWNNEVILLEHTIRPEGLSIFFAGSIFFLLQRLLSRGPSFPIYITLVVLAALMALVQFKFALGAIFIVVYASYFYIHYHPKAIRWIILFFPLMLGWYMLGAFFLVSMGVCQYFQDKQKVVFGGWINFLLGVLIIIAIFGLQKTINACESEPQSSFMAKTYFTINCRLIANSVGFERCFTIPEKKTVRFAVENIVDNGHNQWPILGFNADQLMYGHDLDKIDSLYGTGIYKKIMIKSLIFCFPDLVHKVIKQMYYYYFISDYPLRVSFVKQMDLVPAIESSKEHIYALPTQEHYYLPEYKIELSDYIPLKSNSVSHFRLLINYIIWKIEMRSSSILIVFAAFYSLVMIFRRQIDLLTILFIVHFLVLLTICIIHTIDIDRYSQALFPIFGIILTLSVERIYDVLKSISQNMTAQ